MSFPFVFAAEGRGAAVDGEGTGECSGGVLLYVGGGFIGATGAVFRAGAA